MTISPLSRRAADEFARALDDRASASSRFALHIDVVDGLVEAGRELPGASPEFREALRQRLSALDVTDASAVSEDHASSNRPLRQGSAHRPWRRRLAISGFVVGVIAGMATGTTLASTQALPGDALYGVKRTMEEVRLALADSDAAKGRRYLQIAETRLDEIHRLVEQDEIDAAEIDRITDTFADMHGAIERGSELLIAAYEQTHDPSSLIDLYREVKEQRAELYEIEAIAPAELRDEANTARAFLTEVTAEVLTREPLTEDLAAADGATTQTAPVGGSGHDGGDARLADEPVDGAADIPPTPPAQLRPDGVEKHPVVSADPPSPSAAPAPEPPSSSTGSPTSASTGGDPSADSESAVTPTTTPVPTDPSIAPPPPSPAADRGADDVEATDQGSADVEADAPPPPHATPPGHSPPGLSTAPGLSDSPPGTNGRPTPS